MGLTGALVQTGNPAEVASVWEAVSITLIRVCALALVTLFGFAGRLLAQSPTFAFAEDSSYVEATHLRGMTAFAKTLGEYEEKLQHAATVMLRSRDPGLRAAAFDTIAAGLATALDLEGGRTYAFARLRGVSHVADGGEGAWRIFTYQHFVNDSTYRYGGVYVPTDATQPVASLTDAAQALGVETDFELRADQWYGAVYYGTRAFTLADGRPAWVLFGYDADGYYHRRKVADVLSFDRRGRPRFGSEVFVGSEQSPELTQSRLVLEYRTDARVRLNYDADLNGIVHDRLVTGPAPKPGLAPGKVPDGSYDGYVLDEAAGLWRFREEYFDRVISVEPPRPTPVLGRGGDERDLFGRARAPRRQRRGGKG